MDERILTYCDLNSDGDKGFMFLELFIRVPYQKFIEGGIFRNPKYQAQHIETLVRVNLLAGTAHMYGLGGDMIDAGVSYFTGDLDNAHDAQTDLYHVSVFDLGLFETVDAHQWNGWRKEDIRDGKGQVILQIPTMWEVAGVNSGNDERVMIARTTASRDEVFKLNTRLNKFFGFCQNVLEPYQVQMLEMQKNQFVTLSDMPEGTTDEMAHIFNDIAGVIIDQDHDFKSWVDQV